MKTTNTKDSKGTKEITDKRKTFVFLGDLTCMVCQANHVRCKCRV